MWNSIKGLITHIGTDILYLENGGMEWEMEASSTTLSQVPRNGKEVRLYTFLQHKDDIMKLYGFISLAEKRLFISLISVSGVGPKLALKMLSGMKADELISNLDKEDVDNLCRIPGLGRKTAQKIILQLRGKLAADEESEGMDQGGGELVDALSSMGFDKKSAAKAVNKILDSTAVKGLTGAQLEQEVLRLAIVELSTAG